MTINKHDYIVKYGSAESVWNRLDTTKSNKFRLWEQCAELTIPHLFPKSSHIEDNEFVVPYNSIGPAAVNNLASKLLLALLPPTGNFFRLVPYQEELDKLTPEQRQQLDRELSKLEQDINMLISIQALRVPLFEAVKLLIVTGNALAYKVKGGSFKVYNPRFYSIERDYIGNVTSILIKEEIDTRLLPKEFFEQEKKEGEKEEVESEDIYTCIYRVDKDNWIAYQEVDEFVLESTIMNYKTETLPYIPLRWTNVHNEDYGRGLVEQYIGDLRSLEGLTQLIVEGSSILARTVFGLKPASTTNIDDLNNALNGDFIVGDLEKDVTTLRVDKGGDFNIPFQLMQQIEQRVSKAFLMFTGAIRDSERTTSAEVRATSAELEATLGGTHSVLTQDLQLPLLRLLLNEVEPKALKITEPSVITGASAISRERDLQNLNYMLQSLAQLGPEVIAQYLNVESYISEIATSLGMDPTKLVKSGEQRQAEANQQAQQEQAMQQQQAMQGQQPQAGGIQ